MELYKKHRPTTFKRVVGNKATCEAIENKLASGDLPHFTLLTGPSGCGKTTLARIIKNELNCGDGDFYEINCANRNGVELARDIEAKFQYRPINGDSRVWLLDECHMMTSACANSLLKVLEDTPKHAYFIFATTNPEKILKTIKTRATEYKVALLKENEVKKLIARVCKKEKIDIVEESVEAIATSCQGSARLALVLLDKVKDLSEDLQLEAIEQSVKEEAQAFELLKCLFGWGSKSDWNTCSKILANLDQEAESIRRYILSCCQGQLLKPSNSRNYDKAYNIATCFENNYYDTGKAGLVMSCYEAITGE